MRYIMSVPNSEGWRLTTPLKVWHHWRLTVQCSHGLRFTSYRNDEQQLYASYSLRLGEATKETVVRGREQWVNGTRSRWTRWEWWWQESSNFMNSSTMSDVFMVLFTFLARFWLAIVKVIPIAKLSSFALCACCGIFHLAHSKLSFN